MDKEKIISLEDFKKKELQKQADEERQKGKILTSEEKKYLTAFDYEETDKEKTEKDKIKELKRRAKQNKNRWNSKE